MIYMPEFYILFFDYDNNSLYQRDLVKLLTSKLRNFYLHNLIITLGYNIFLVRKDADHGIEFYIQSAIDELTDVQAIGISEIQYFIIPVRLDEISQYTSGIKSEIELMKQINRK